MTKVETILRLIINLLANQYVDDLDIKDYYVYSPYNKYTVSRPEKGDIAIALSAGYINCSPYTVGIVENIIEDGLCVRDFETDNMCNFKSESFLIIPKRLLGYKLKFGRDKEIYDMLKDKFYSLDGNYFDFGVIETSNNKLHWYKESVFKDTFDINLDIDENMSIEDITDKAIEEFKKLNLL